MGMKRGILLPGAVLAAGILAAPSVWALDPFFLHIETNSGANTLDVGFDSIEDAVEAVTPEQYRTQLNYDDTTDVSVILGLRGLTANLGFGSVGSNLSFSVPEAGINQVFVGKGGTAGERRMDAIEQLKDYLKENKDALKSLLTKLAQFSPIDPVAGNPDSLMTRRMFADFDNGFTHKVSQIWGCGTTAFELNNDQPLQVAAAGDVGGLFEDAQARAAALRGENEFAMGAVMQSVEASNVKNGTATGSQKTTSLLLPFTYTVKFDGDPRQKLRFEFPISATDTEGAKSYSMGFGLAYVYPITDDWSLTPAASAGATGSVDLGSAGSVGAYSITSAYTQRFGGFAASLGNSIGRYQTIPMKLGEIEAAADIKNTVYSNGIMLTGPNSMIARNLVMEYTLVDTRITGDTVYAQYYDEAGVALGYINTERGVVTSYFKGGLSYLKGDHDITGIKLNLGMRF